MTVQEIFTLLGITPVGAIAIFLIGISGLVEVSKININPWSWLRKQIRRLLYGDIIESVKQIQNDLAEHIAQSQRKIIMDFTTESMNGKTHTQEQFNFIFKTYRHYEEYVKARNLTNDEVNESMKYIRNLYQKCLEEGAFSNDN